MLFGTADLDALAAGAPRMPSLDAEPTTLAGAEVLQAALELPGALRECLLPPALHPTDPPLVWISIWRCAGGPLGPFALAQVRVSCRSGLRPRGLLVGAVVDSPDAGAVLAARWGFRCRAGTVVLARHYDAVDARVVVDGGTVLALSLRDPDPLGGHVQYTASMHLAETPRGLRLVQVDPEVRIERAERGRPSLATFDGDAWGDARIAPGHPVAGTIAVADVTLPRLRYLCRPDVWAFDGTEAL